MTYARTAQQRVGDFQESRLYETEVSQALPPNVTRFDATDDLDIWVPGYFVEVKEKKQPLTERWLVPGLDERDTFIMDELSVRRACRHWPHAFFVVRDRPGQRLFLVSVAEMVCVERTRVNRGGKGKWILDLTHFTQLGSLADLHETITELLRTMNWKRSECLTQKEVPQV
jgi:hypothetical protein